MVGDETLNLEQSPSVSLESEVIINVPFPYPKDSILDDSLQFAAAPILKIDYAAVEIPPPKKTMNIRRSGQQTRIVRLENSLKQEAAAEKAAEPAPVSCKKSAHQEVSAKSDEVGDTMQKLLKSVGTISLAAQESNRQYATISTSLEKQSAVLPKLEALQKHLDQSHKVETANQRLFDVMHGELKGYKDNFLFDALQKPVIRDLLALFDDLCGQARRVARFLNDSISLSDAKVGWKAELQASHDNLNNTVFFIVEVLNRLDVTMLDGNDTVLDLKLHKVVGVEPTYDLAEKNHIARVVRPGFVWKERMLRPTEVIIKKYTAAPDDEVETTEN